MSKNLKSKIVCNENDVIVFDILFCLSGKSCKEANEILNEAKNKLEEFSTLNITPENHKRTRKLMEDSLLNNLLQEAISNLPPDTTDFSSQK